MIILEHIDNHTYWYSMYKLRYGHGTYRHVAFSCIDLNSGLGTDKMDKAWT